MPSTTRRCPEADSIPRGGEWIRDCVAAIEPRGNAVTTAGGERITYDWLVVALGIQVNWPVIRPGRRHR